MLFGGAMQDYYYRIFQNNLQEAKFLQRGCY